MAKSKLRFKVKIDGSEIGAGAAITPPIDVPEVFGTRGRVPVSGTINGYPFRSSLMPMRGCHMVPVNKELRVGAGVKPGDVVEVIMQRDEAPRTVEMPEILKQMLTKNKTANDNWEKLPYTHKKEIAIWIEGAKQDETKARRLAKAIRVLESGTKWTGS